MKKLLSCFLSLGLLVGPVDRGCVAADDTREQTPTSYWDTARKTVSTTAGFLVAGLLAFWWGRRLAHQGAVREVNRWRSLAEGLFKEVDTSLSRLRDEMRFNFLDHAADYESKIGDELNRIHKKYAALETAHG